MYFSKEVRPGVVNLYKKPHVSGMRTFVRTLVLFCPDCGQECNKGDGSSLFLYMVNDNALWKAVVPKDGILCKPCFERRLGRNLLPSEFRTLSFKTLRKES
jgi:hypothetical protein